MNTVSVRVSYRPIKVGWCVAEGALDQFRKAIRLSSTLWGGKFNPIIPIGKDLRDAQMLLSTFRVDALFSVTDAPEVVRFVAQQFHLSWPDVHQALFIKGVGGPLPVFLDIYHATRKLAESREKRKIPALDGQYRVPNLLTLVNVNNDDPLSNVLLATCGGYPDGDYCPIDYRQFVGTIETDNGRISISLPLPTKPFLDAAETSYQSAIVTTRPIVDPDPALGTFLPPFIPELNRFYARSGNVREDVRIEPEGALGTVVKLDASDLRLNAVTALDLISAVLARVGISAVQSSAGRIAMRVIRHMGGLDGCRVFKIKGVRDLLHEFSVPKYCSHREALARIGPRFDPYTKLFIEPRETDELRPQDVFLHLIKQKVIRPGIVLTCNACQLDDWYSTNDLAEQVECPYCGSGIDSGPQLHDQSWQYRVSGLFARTRDHEGSIPVTLALMQVSRCLAMPGMTWITGMDLTWSRSGQQMKGEADFIVLARDYDSFPQLLLGESKTNMEVSAEQIARVADIATLCSEAGLKTFIMFAKAGRDFTEEELTRKRSRWTSDLNFILASPAELEPYNPYENVSHPEIRSAAPHSLDQWAAYSRTLYSAITLPA